MFVSAFLDPIEYERTICEFYEILTLWLCANICYHASTAVQPVKDTKIAKQKHYTAKDEGKTYVSTHYVSCRRPVTQAERKRVLQYAQSFKSSKPFNLITMKQSQVYQGFWLVSSLPLYFLSYCYVFLTKCSKICTDTH